MIPVVASVGLARMMERAGASAVVAEGTESGGHIGELTTMTLVPQVCSAVKIPVIAAGGIADGRGVAAAFMLGACGVQVGTRFLVASECNVHQNYKDKICLLYTSSVSSFVGFLKGKSSLIIFERHSNLKYKYGNRQFWCRGYYVDTAGKNAKKIAEYIQNQLKEDQIEDQMTIKEYIDPFTGSKE